MKKAVFMQGVLFSMFILQNSLYGQAKRSHELLLGNLQIKEQRNFGMVFNGFQLEYRFGLRWTINTHEILYQPMLGWGNLFSHEMAGVQLPRIVPINITWTKLFSEQNGHTIKAGTNLIADYSYQWYPSLHSGRLFWMSKISVSPVIQYQYERNGKRAAIYVQNSLLGFTSHTQEYDPYWFSIKKNWIVEPHKNMRFGSFNTYNHTKISLEFVRNISKKHSFLYEFDYLGSYYGVRFSRLSHNFIWKRTL